MKICLWFAWAWPVFPFLTFQVSCHGFVSCKRHGWCDNAIAQGTDNKWTVPGFGPPWHCSQACSSILFFCFNALRCLNSICQFVMFDATNSLNVVIYLSKNKTNYRRGYFNYHKLLFQILDNKLSLKQLILFKVQVRGWGHEWKAHFMRP